MVTLLKPAPCPLCELSGGFHDWDLHPFEVPVEHLKSGDRRDAYLIEQARQDPITAYLLDEYDRLIDDQFWGIG